MRWGKEETGEMYKDRYICPESNEYFTVCFTFFFVPIKPMYLYISIRCKQELQIRRIAFIKTCADQRETQNYVFFSSSNASVGKVVFCDTCKGCRYHPTGSKTDGYRSSGPYIYFFYDTLSSLRCWAVPFWQPILMKSKTTLTIVHTKEWASL